MPQKRNELVASQPPQNFRLRADNMPGVHLATRTSPVEQLNILPASGNRSEFTNSGGTYAVDKVAMRVGSKTVWAFLEHSSWDPDSRAFVGISDERLVLGLPDGHFSGWGNDVLGFQRSFEGKDTLLEDYRSQPEAGFRRFGELVLPTATGLDVPLRDEPRVAVLAQAA